MSTTPAAEAVASSQIFATLVRGRVYYLKDREFLKGIAQPVTLAEKEWLEARAYDLVSIESEGEHQQRAKFTFSTTPAVEKVEAPSRVRARA